MATSEKKTAAKVYIAVNAIDCDGLKGKPHIDPGKPVPDGIDPDDINALLASGDIKELE